MLPRLTVSDNSLRLLLSGYLQLLFFVDEQNYWISHIYSRPHFRTQIRILSRISCFPVIGWNIGCTAEECFSKLFGICRCCYRHIASLLIHLVFLFCSIQSHNLGRSSGHHRWIRNNPFPSWPVFSCPSWAGKVHFCPLFDIDFLPLLLSASFSFSFHVPWRIVFAKPEDLETWPNHLSFRFLTRVRSSSYSPMAAWIFLRTSLLVTWSLYEMFNSLR